MYKNRKPLIIGILCVLVVVMAVGFALLREQLTITGSSHVDSNWNIRITSISANVNGGAEDKEASGDCTTRTSGGCNSTSATFNAGLTTPGDYITYTVTVTNSGSLDGVVSGITLTPETSSSDPILVTKSGLEQGDKITANGGTNTIEVTVKYNPEVTSQPTTTSSEVTLTINYQQDLGQVSPPAPTYAIYSIGDTITYKDSTWYVIKNSASNENYVTLMRQTVLTNEELGSYAYGSGYDTMSYYWSSTCHPQSYGYSEWDDSRCSGHNDYAGSKVKEAVEAYASSKGMMNDLDTVDGYKIRLITRDELENSFGYAEFDVPCGGCGAKYWSKASDTPTWVYSGFGEGQNNVDGYWTMIPDVNDASNVWNVYSDGNLNNFSVGNFNGVRPVINLLKSNIPAQQ